jgi:hypothetical protein
MNFLCILKTGPLIKIKTNLLRRNPDKKTNRLMYSNIGASFRETVPLNTISNFCILKVKN